MSDKENPVGAPKPRLLDPKLHLVVLGIVIISEFIRQRKFTVGPGVILLPSLSTLRREGNRLWAESRGSLQ